MLNLLQKAWPQFVSLWHYFASLKMFRNPNLLCLQLYIVYLGDVKHGHPNDVIASHHDMLTTVLGRYVAYASWVSQ